MVCALAYGRSCSRVDWILFRAERDCNCKFNDNCNRNGNYGGGGDGEPCGVEGAAGWGGGV
jgi:hypothetical protein